MPWAVLLGPRLADPDHRRAELRCYMCDPDGYLIEVGQSTGMLKVILARTDTEA